jgi:hypothetical protein
MSRLAQEVLLLLRAATKGQTEMPRRSTVLASAQSRRTAAVVAVLGLPRCKTVATAVLVVEQDQTAVQMRQDLAALQHLDRATMAERRTRSFPLVAVAVQAQLEETLLATQEALVVLEPLPQSQAPASRVRAEAVEAAGQLVLVLAVPVEVVKEIQVLAPDRQTLAAAAAQATHRLEPPAALAW